jgi:hypothetical protein
VDQTQPASYVSVRLNPVSRTLTFLLDKPASPLRVRQPVVVRTEQGMALGRVVPTIGDLAPRRAAITTTTFVRPATADDELTRSRQEHREREARRVALVMMRDLGLPMKLSRVEQLFDGSRLIFYFTAEGRVDFRELVRQLAAEFRTRIEMRQIGVRDEADCSAATAPAAGRSAAPPGCSRSSRSRSRWPSSSSSRSTRRSSRASADGSSAACATSCPTPRAICAAAAATREAAATRPAAARAAAGRAHARAAGRDDAARIPPALGDPHGQAS